jgi:hypothetical protein
LDVHNRRIATGADRDFPAAGNSGVAHVFGTRFHMDF